MRSTLSFSVSKVHYRTQTPPAEYGYEPAAFRAALKGWEQAGLETMAQVRIKGGAA